MLKRTLTIRIRGSIYVVPIREIIYMEKYCRKIKVHTKERDYLYYAGFEEVIGDLDIRFSWCHRSYILNMERVIYLDDMRIGMDGSSELIFGRNTFIRFKKEVERYLRWKKSLTSLSHDSTHHDFDFWKNMEYNPLYTFFYEPKETIG